MGFVASSVIGIARLFLGEGTRRRLAVMMFLGAFSAATGAAHAQINVDRLDRLPVERWGAWESLGGVTFFRPDCLAVQVNRIDCFTMTQGGVARSAWDGQRWTGPTVLGGLAMEPGSQPNCTAWAVDHIDCFVRRTGDKAPFRRSIHGTFITGWEALGGVLSTDPECVSLRPERLDCFARGTDNRLHRNSFDGNIWTTWSGAGAPVEVYSGSKPSCVVFRGDIHCMFATPVADPNNSNTGFTPRLKHFHFPASGGVIQRDMQGGRLAETGPTFSDASPKCFVATSIHCFAPKWNSQATSVSMGWWIFDNGPNWALSNLGDNVSAGDWDCVVRSEDRIDCVELVQQSNASSQRLLRHRVFDRGQGLRVADSGLAPLSGARTIRCITWAADRIDCFAGGAFGDSSPLMHTWLTVQYPTEYVRRLPGG